MKILYAGLCLVLSTSAFADTSYRCTIKVKGFVCKDRSQPCLTPIFKSTLEAKTYVSETYSLQACYVDALQMKDKYKELKDHQTTFTKVLFSYVSDTASVNIKGELK